MKTETFNLPKEPHIAVTMCDNCWADVLLAETHTCPTCKATLCPECICESCQHLED